VKWCVAHHIVYSNVIDRNFRNLHTHLHGAAMSRTNTSPFSGSDPHRGVPLIHGNAGACEENADDGEVSAAACDVKDGPSSASAAFVLTPPLASKRATRTFSLLFGLTAKTLTSIAIASMHPRAVVRVPRTLAVDQRDRLR
jgi:hypothetical protein